MKPGKKRARLSAVVVLASALLLPAGGASALPGRGTVDSGDIADRSIKLRDLSRRAKNQLRAAAGNAKAGPAGPQGPAGPPGPGYVTEAFAAMRETTAGLQLFDVAGLQMQTSCDEDGRITVEMRTKADNALVQVTGGSGDFGDAGDDFSGVTPVPVTLVGDRDFDRSDVHKLPIRTDESMGIVSYSSEDDGPVTAIVSTWATDNGLYDRTKDCVVSGHVWSR